MSTGSDSDNSRIRGSAADVRKGSAFPDRVSNDFGLRPGFKGRSPEDILTVIGRPEAFRTSGGTAANEDKESKPSKDCNQHNGKQKVH